MAVAPNSMYIEFKIIVIGEPPLRFKVGLIFGFADTCKINVFENDFPDSEVAVTVME